MGGLGRAQDRSCIEDYPWIDLSDEATIVDVGGGIGTICMQLHCTHPNIKVIVQDKAPVVEQAASVWKERYPKAASQGTAKLMTHDFFQKNPVSGAEIYWLRHILHDWDGVDAVPILSSIRDSMTSNSVVLIAEILMTTTLASDKIRAAPQPLLANYGCAMNTAHAMDLNMMAMTEGKERSPEEYERIVQAAGLKVVKIWDCRGLLSIIECRLNSWAHRDRTYE
ncbi:hypothetical protein H2204_006248 [Knufia peltigerae]|uniref:O-methyltransferase C-terminal domain-containing protein n=1 Tax=Knufia peltigerae TaxID=1002370 RepID=A0AA39CWS9_9EURO|nr:hypothetical protein H2204_006248 [Knufia peltigerae]